MGLENYRTRAHRRRVLGGGRLRVLVYGAILVPAMLGLALLFALLLDSPRARLRRFSPHRDLPAVRGARRHRLAAVGLPLPARREPVPLRCCEPFGLPEPDLLAPGTIMRLDGQHRRSGAGSGFNMLVLYTALRAIPRELYESARIDGCSECADRVAHQDADDRAGDRHDHDLLHHRDPAGVHRADDAAAAHELAAVDLDPADEDLPGRVRAQRPLLGRRHLDRARRHHAGAVVRLPAAGPARAFGQENQ